MTRQVCEKVCNACPFRRDSLAGWLGESSHDPWDFLSSYNHGETPLPCHKQVKWGQPDSQEQAANAKICRGSLIMMRNENKLPRDRAFSDQVLRIPKDKELIFEHHGKFMKHHRQS